MRLHALGCYGGEAPGFHQPSHLVDGRLLLDAGSVTAALPFDSQGGIDHVLVSHSHLDHIAALAFLADNLSTVRTKPIEVWSIAPVIRHLRTHIFNDIIWPDFTTIPTPRNPILSFHEIREGQPQRVGGYEVIAVRVNHTVEATGYLVSDGEASLLFQGGSGPARELWEGANAASRLQAVIVETSYPNRLQHLADASGHLTPPSLRAELTKLTADAPIYAP